MGFFNNMSCGDIKTFPASSMQDLKNMPTNSLRFQPGDNISLSSEFMNNTIMEYRRDYELALSDVYTLDDKDLPSDAAKRAFDASQVLDTFLMNPYTYKLRDMMEDVNDDTILKTHPPIVRPFKCVRSGEYSCNNKCMFCIFNDFKNDDFRPNLGITDCSICFCKHVDCAGEIFKF